MFALHKWGLLNPIFVPLQIVAKHHPQGRVVKDKEVRIVRRDVIIFPALIRPAKSDDRRPTHREKITQGGVSPNRRRNFWMVKVAPEFSDDNWLGRRELR